mgnify:CR=1 FL=1
MEPDSSEGLGSGLSRRKFVAGSAAGFATVTLAGCSGEEGEPATTDEPTTAEPQPENYVVTDDIIVSSAYVPPNMGFASSCSPSRTFAPGMHPVFKIGVYDPETGDVLGNDELDGVTVNIDGYDSVELAWSGDDEEHPADEWGASWAIPEDAEPGSVSYTVEVTDGDANFTNVGILESSFQIIDYSQQFIVRDDLYAGSAGIPEDNAFVSSCQPENQFAPGMMVGFDISVYDGASGMPVGPSETDGEDIVSASDIEEAVTGIESVTVTIPDRDVTVEAGWSAAENDDGEVVDLIWNGTWFIPEDAETGDVTYEIEVTPDTEFVDTPVEGAHIANTFTIVDA